MFKLFFVLLLLVCFLFGCSQFGKEVVKLDKENYQANKELAKETLKTWSFNSGFIRCAGFADKIRFPIQSPEEVRAILNNPTITLGLAELDEIAKVLKQENGEPYWSNEDESLGCTLGIRVRLAVVSLVDVAKMFPRLAPYLSFIP